ncbi:DUF2993 domain-containing protein [Nocardia sp. NPDC050712]|uniref:LmeA family phospholipid-binding protein n=1 Tax=Nocardia sp. NPDC050712 TaxID=3155518 RepID=UPI0033E64CB9
MRGLLISIVVLGILLVAGDRVAVVLAQNEIGRKVAAEYNLTPDPSVGIGGFPFLTQAVEGRYRNVDVLVGEWSDQDITVRDLDVRLTDVSAPLGDLVGGDTSNLVAATATATGVVPYDTVKGFAPEGVRTISNSPEGLRVTGTFSVEGIPVPGTVVVTVAPTAEGFQVTPVSVQAAAGGPTIPLALLRSSLTFTVPLQRLPLGARLTAITPSADGLLVTAVAQDVHFSDLP